MKRRKQSISHPYQLNRLSVLPVLRTPGKGTITIEDDTIDSKTRTEWESELNKYYFACGCDKAAIGLLIGIVSIILWHVVFPEGQEVSLISKILISAGIIFVFTGIGKSIGLFLIQRKLDNLIKQIQSKWEKPLEPISEPWSCG